MILIAAPLEGEGGQSFRVSIRTPYWGRLAHATFQGALSEFQSAPPHWGRLFQRFDDVVEIGVSIRAPALGATGWAASSARLIVWQNRQVDLDELREWVDGSVADFWGKNAACRVFHICASGYDVEPEPFAKGCPSEKPVQPLLQVPGAANPAVNLYDVCQALSWVATKRNNPEERVDRQAQIPNLIKKLNSRRPAAS